MTQRNLEILDRLAEIGLEIARSIEQRAKTAGSQEELGELKKSYELVVYDVLQTLHMRSALAAGEVPRAADVPLREIVGKARGILQPPVSRSIN